MRHTPHCEDVGIDAIEQGRICKQVELGGITCTQRNAERLDTPARSTRERPIEVFDEDQADHRMGEPGHQHGPHREGTHRQKYLQCECDKLARNHCTRKIDRPLHARAPQRAHQYDQEGKPGRRAQNVREHTQHWQRRCSGEVRPGGLDARP